MKGEGAVKGPEAIEPGISHGCPPVTCWRGSARTSGTIWPRTSGSRPIINVHFVAAENGQAGENHL